MLVRKKKDIRLEDLRIRLGLSSYGEYKLHNSYCVLMHALLA